MIPKSQYGRASGMLDDAQSISQVFAPLFAGALMGIFGFGSGLPVIMGIDIVTFLAAVSILLAVRIPQPAVSEAGRKARGNLLSESAFGFRYIAARRSLLGLQLVFFLVNFLFPMGFATVTAMILSRSGNDALILGAVNSAAAIGGVSGGIALSAWGGPKRRVHGVLGGMVLGGVLGSVLMGLGRGIVVWAIASVFSSLILPLIHGSHQANLQAKVAPDIQGKVFAARRMIAQVTVPAAFLIAGPLADRVFEPPLRDRGSFVGVFGPIVGTGPGAGVALLLNVFRAPGAPVRGAGALRPARRAG